MATETDVMKLEVEIESCCVCGNADSGDLQTPEEYDASSSLVRAPLRAMLLHLNNNKVVPEGRLCQGCIQRTHDAYEFSTALSTRGVPPLSEKIRALRRRLHELTQKIDVFIVVGGSGGGPTGGAYSEDDIIVVDRAALAAAAAADDEELERARNARGDTVYQCTVCPASFQRVAEYRAHAGAHGAASLHSCWTCGAQLATRAALRDHAALHAHPRSTTCYLCNTTFQTEAELRRHVAAEGAAAGGACPAVCPVCGRREATRGALATHVAATHGRGAQPPHACAACFRTFPDAELLAAHALRHRQDKQFLCGYDMCILRFATRSNLLSHIRKCHAADVTEESGEEPPAHRLEEQQQQQQEAQQQQGAGVSCAHCTRTFGSVAAMKRHARVHRPPAAAPPPAAPLARSQDHDSHMEEGTDGEGGEEAWGGAAGDGGEVEYLEVEELEEEEEEGDEYEQKPDVMQLH